MTSTDKKKEYEDLKEQVKVLRYMLERDQNAYYDAQARFRETQVKLDAAVIKLNWLRESLEDETRNKLNT